MRPALILPLLIIAAPAMARDPILSLPIDCTLGEDCFILQYVDADPGPGAADFTCGPMSYDGHLGTDFAVTSFAAMEAGVDVLAPAPGIVRGLRDGMPDLGLDDTPAAELAGKDCGNGVVIDHGGGWESQLCHLKRGSLTVETGQRVAMGQVLGQVGYSGRTQFPHVHIAVRHDGTVVDPFDGDGIQTCGADDGPDDDLWGDSPGYLDAGLAQAGFDIRIPDYEAVKAGSVGVATLPTDAPALVGWGLAYGARAGDAIEVTILWPDGDELVAVAQEIDRNQAMSFRAAGKRVPEGGWQTGDYPMTVRLLRGDTVLDERATTLRVE